uniref:Uncharacterized protein n=1 Tax=Arundo donax TaxID=35708 RepID=A0A0A8ZLM2_ARUDO
MKLISIDTSTSEVLSSSLLYSNISFFLLTRCFWMGNNAQAFARSKKVFLQRQSYTLVVWCVDALLNIPNNSSIQKEHR